MCNTSEDYLVIGSNGFAQLGQPYYREKKDIEMPYLIHKLKELCPVPEEFSSVCRYRVKGFEHDFGRYHEVCLIYDYRYISRLEMSEKDEDIEKHDRFWEFANLAEGIDLECEEFTQDLSNLWSEYIFNNPQEFMTVIKTDKSERKLKIA